MVTRARIPTESMTSTPPASDLATVWDHLRHDAIPLRDAMETLTAIFQKSLAEKGKRAWDDFSSMSVAEVVRQMKRGLSIKFVAVIGLTGAGKSSVIKTLTGAEVHVEHSISAGTTTFAMFPAVIDDERYILIDTPGFNDRLRSDFEVFEEILKWFQTMSPYCDLDGILYVYDITPPRMNKSAQLNLDMLAALCGKKFYKNITIITTMWGNMSDRAFKAAERRQEELKAEAWKELINGGARVLQHRHGVAEPQHPPTDPGEIEDLEEQRKNANEELCDMMDYYRDSEPITPIIQQELRQKIGILDTRAGTVLRKNLGLPPTPDHIDSDGNSVPSSPGYTNDQSGFLQSPPSLTTTNHCGAPSPPEKLRDEETPKKEEEKERKETQEEKEEKESPPLPKGWWQNLLRALKWFLVWR